MVAKSQKISRLKVLLLVALSCLIVAALLAVSYHIVRNHRKVQRYGNAVAAFNKNDWDLAEKLLKEALQSDSNNEDAVVKLAVVSEKLNHWSEAGMLWARAARLNAFKPEYIESMLAAFLQSGNTNWLQVKLEKMRPLTSDRHLLLLAFSFAHQGKPREGKAEFEKIKDNELLNSPLGRLTALYIAPGPAMTPQKIAGFEALVEGDDAAAFYAQMTLADYYLYSGKIADAEKYLRKTVSFNPLTGALNLAHFYFLTGKTEESVKLYRANSKGLAPRGAMRYGEALAAANQPDEILALALKYREGNKQNVQAGYYLEALAAFLKKDDALLAQKIAHLGNGYPNTPIAQLLLLYNAVKLRNPDAVMLYYTQLHAMKSSPALKTDCTNMVQAFTLDLLQKNELDAAARISGQMLKLNENDIIFTRAVITHSFRNNAMSQLDIDNALDLYPNDPALLTIAADFYLQKGDFAAAGKYARTHLKGAPGNISAQLQIIASLEGRKKVQEAANAFTALYHKDPANQKLLTMYLKFCSQHKLIRELTNLETFLAASPDANFRSAARLAGAEKAYAEKNREKMHEILMRIVEDPAMMEATNENADMLFRTASLLGETDYLLPAIAVFERLLKMQPNNVLVLVNMSELYAALGNGKDAKNTAKALDLARRAHAIDANSPFARESYAIRLFENKKYAETERLLAEAAQRGEVSPRALEAWRISTENTIRELATGSDVLLCSAQCRSLLRVFPDNKLAKDTLNALEMARQKAAEKAAAEKAAAKDITTKTP